MCELAQVDEKTATRLDGKRWRNFNEKEPTDCAGSSGRGEAMQPFFRLSVFLSTS